MGLRSFSSLVLSSFLAAASSTYSLQDALLVDCFAPPDPTLDLYLTRWMGSFGLPPPPLIAHKQSARDGPAIGECKSLLVSSLCTPREKAIFMAASAPHSAAWVGALPIASCGLRLDDEAVRVAIAFRLGLQVCNPHVFRCGSSVDAWGSHALVCKVAPGRTTRHHALNDIISRAVASADYPIDKEPSGLISGSGKRPDGATQIPMRNGKYLAWDVTVATTLAESYLAASSTLSGSAANMIAARKVDKYRDLPSRFTFQPIAFENLGPASSSTAEFLGFLGRRISLVSGEDKEEAYLWQRISLCLQRFNAILVHQSFKPPPTESDE